jgi:ATP-dependent Lon protease
MVVYKRPETSKFFSSFGLPSFLRDWIVMKFSSKPGVLDLDKVQHYISEVIPNRNQWESLKGRMISSGERIRILVKLRVRFDVATGMALYELPDFSFPAKKFEAVIDERLISSQETRDQLLFGQETWGVVELGWRLVSMGSGNKETGCVVLTDFKPFQPYRVDTAYYQQARSQFTTEEWMDCLLSGMDYNPAGFDGIRPKMSMLCRLLPFVEKRINLIELAPKGTGKSYLFSQLSKYGWLVSGGSISRARLFYDIASKTPGLMSRHDFVALDEIQSIRFPNEEELRGALKGYLESGEYRVGDYHGVSEAGFVLLGNIQSKLMDVHANMFQELPLVFQESALLDRFHGFIRGWNIPRMRENLKARGWALNTEYLSVVFHELRNDIRYRALTDDLLDVPVSADGRDTESIKRIMTGMLKLFFPNCIYGHDLPLDDIRSLCLENAKTMRLDIRKQLSLLDSEYRAEVPDIRIKTST